MRILVVHPGPAWSVHDVAEGWTRALRELGHEVAVYDFGYRMSFYSRAYIDGKKALTDEMAVAAAMETIGNMIYGLWPDLILFVSGFWVPSDLLEVIRARGQRAVLLATESPYEDDRHLELAGYMHAVVLNDPTNCAQMAERCDNVYYAPHSYDPNIHTPGPIEDDKRSDVCVIGTGYPSRIQWLEQVDWSGIDLCLRGNWTALAEHELRKYAWQADPNECVDNADTVRWYRSTRSSLNLYRRESNRPELSEGWAMGPREIELAATRTFYMTEPRGENREVLPMIPTIEDPSGYREQLDWWLAHDTARMSVIDQAQAAVADWTFTNRASRLLDRLDRQPVSI